MMGTHARKPAKSGNIMHTRHNPFDWIPGDTLAWPSKDKKLLQIDSWVADVDKIVYHVKDFSVAIQAGGACGLWPARLACYFKQVYTFEPNIDNFRCLQENLKHFESSTVFCHAGLSDKVGRASLKRDNFEDGNAGAWYTVPGEDFPTITIDTIQLESCGLIMLDIEGSELEALKGAELTLTRFKPVVVVEQKQLPHMSIRATEAGDYLKSLGYKHVATYHNDAVYVC